MMKLSGLALCLLLTASGMAQDLAKPVTYRTVAIPLHSALEEISRQAKVNLYASAQLADEPIILSLKSVPTQEAMDRIAQAIAATWQKKSPTEYLLVRTGKQEDELNRAAVDAREEGVREAVERLLKSEDPSELTDAGIERTAQSFAGALKLFLNNPMTKRGMWDTRQIQAVSSRSPSHHALLRLIRLLPTRRLAELQAGEKVVFSSSPNRYQEEIPAGREQVRDEFLDQQRKLAAAFRKAHPGPLVDAEMYFQNVVSTVPEGDVKLVLIVERSWFGSVPPWATLILVAPDDTVVGYASEGLVANPAPNPVDVDPKTEAPLSEDSKVVYELVKLLEKGGSSATGLSARQRELILDPAGHDPLSFLVSDGFLCLADVNHSNLAACPTESMANNYLEPGTSGFKLASFVRTLRHMGLTVTRSDGWVVATPSDPAEEWRRRMNRELLGQCVQEGDRSGCISIETAGKLAASERADRDSVLPNYYHMFGEKYDPYHGRDRHLLRFYDSLTPSQLSQLASGNSIRFGDLSKEQILCAERLFYSKNGQGGQGLEWIAEFPHAGGDQGSSLYYREPTEIMPEGLPVDATFTMATENKDVLFAGYRDGEYRVAYESSLNSVAYTVAMKQAGRSERDPRQEEYPGFHRMNEVDWVAPGHSRELLFDFRISPRFRVTAKLREAIQGNEKWTLDSLPPELKKRYDAALLEARDQIASAREASPGTAAPPR